MTNYQWYLAAWIFFFFWVVIGYLWLFRRKRIISGRFNHPVTNDDLIQLARSGDREVQKLRRDTWVYIAIGAIGAVVLSIVKYWK